MFFGLPLLPPDQVVSRYFPTEMWADISSTGDRTTNCCESFHGKFNAEFTSARPNIFNFMEILKQIQADTYNFIFANQL